jgi:FAD/FMN-containing dehydrogenase
MLRAATLSGTVELPENAVRDLRRRLSGPLLLRDDPAYDGARAVWNRMIDRRPALIARCAGADDVVSALCFAREHDLLISVRGGGHNVTGNAVCDDGLMLDLSPMKGARVDPRRGVITAEPGLTWKDFDTATQRHGLVTTGGIVSSTGVPGLTLGGGHGWLMRKHGLTCDNLTAVDLVAADGRRLRASADENPELFWGVRGGGGNFGIVTSFEFKAHPVHTVYAGPVFWSLDKAPEVMRFFGDFITNAPPELNGIFAFLVVEPVAPFPPHLHNKNVCGAVLCYVGPMEKAEDVVRPLVDFTEPELVGLGPIPFPVLQTVFDATSPPGLPNYWKADFVTELSEGLIAAHAKFGPRVPNPLSGAVTFSVSGAAHRAGKNDSAWSYRDASFSHIIYAVDADPGAMPAHTEWVREYWEALHPYSAGGAYVNFMMDEGEDRVAASYRDNYTRLAAVKAEYDPNNLFRMNQNIKPSSA